MNRKKIIILSVVFLSLVFLILDFLSYKVNKIVKDVLINKGKDVLCQQVIVGNIDTSILGSSIKISNIEISDSYIYLANIIKVFIEDYGFKKSADANLPLDKNNKPLPLYTYPAIEYLKPGLLRR